MCALTPIRSTRSGPESAPEPKPDNPPPPKLGRPAKLPVTEISGIAGRRAARLAPYGIRTCLDLADAVLARTSLASSIFVPGFPDNARIAELVKDVVLPLNLLAWPGLPDGATLETPSVNGSVNAGYAAALTVGVVL